MMIDDSYGPPNVIVTLDNCKVPTKRRLSQAESSSNKIPRRRKRFNSVGSTSIPRGYDENEMLEQKDDTYHSLSTTTTKQDGSTSQTSRWPCHTCVLFNESPYFAALFGENFSESKDFIVYLPSTFIKRSALDSILKYMYTLTIQKPKSLKELCDMYSAADYLGMDKLCTTLTELLNEAVHHCVCYCTASCIESVPELFLFSRTRAVQLQDEKMAKMTQKVISVLANDPEKTLSTYWSSRHMASLLTRLPADVSQALSQKVLYRVNKSNAIESLYACFTASNSLSVTDPLLSWSKPLHATLTSVQSRATRIIARHFDFYCCQYPALLSCIDGITYSIEFLEYLLLHILEDQMDCSNVGKLYQGIVCDLMTRHAVQYNEQVKHILNVAKVMITHYITRRISDIRREKGLDELEKPVLKQLADELGVRPKSLISSSHPLFHRGLFSFFLPAIPTLQPSSSSAYTRRSLSRHSSLSTTTHTTLRCASLPVRSTPDSRYSTLTSTRTSSSSFTGQLTKWFRKLSHRNHTSTNRLSNRTLSTSTAQTSMSAHSSSWSHINLTTTSTSKIKREKPVISFSTIKRKKPSENSAQQQVSAPLVGMHRRVQLNRRPTLTVGTVAFVGHVNFAEGIWIGVELDRRVGKNDGSVDGYRYFATSPNRGVFVRPEDVSPVL
ncbi:hypothetical protein BDF20DRAFT_109765 [Mycotypha africana]|uniref:uncharacterized protein n=1 Tax=Mycotypha africana TaxID=64632 RepID=UPI002301ECBD|nr:uncharacterized protein BDF20DRAFT_109765 [Mycotypha africana]KAI8970186.1 hypothetical protein BDF20DRAFT_109765 [Mycotypha africana]